MTVRAAGGLVLRGPRSDREVLLVQRRRYRDWSFPKGKALPGEADEACALREVEEETGLRCALGDEIGVTSYRDASGRPKVVRYFEMHPRDGEARPAAEVSDVRWAPLAAAADLLTWDRDRELLGRVAARG